MLCCTTVRTMGMWKDKLLELIITQGGYTTVSVLETYSLHGLNSCKDTANLMEIPGKYQIASLLGDML